MAERYAMRDKLGREATPHVFETIENELERVWAALKAINASISSASSTVDLSDYITGPNPALSASDEIMLWSGVTGRIAKRASGTGPVKVTSGVMSVSAIDLASAEVTGLLPVANLDLDGNATHVLYMDGTMGPILASGISGLEHRILDGSIHSDSVAGVPEPGALIVGVASAETIDAGVYWLDGEAVPVVSDLLADDPYWYDGEPAPSIGFSSEGRWSKLDPPLLPNAALIWNDVTGFDWAESGDITKLLYGDGTWAQPYMNSVSPGNPTGTTSLTDVMMGLGASVTFTPVKGGRVILLAFFNATNNTINDGATAGMRTGTGTAPANGDAVTGTQRGATKTFTAAAAGAAGFLGCMSIATGLTAGQTYWLDLSLKAVTGGTAAVSSCSFFMIEL